MKLPVITGIYVYLYIYSVKVCIFRYVTLISYVIISDYKTILNWFFGKYKYTIRWVFIQLKYIYNLKTAWKIMIVLSITNSIFETKFKNGVQLG